MKTISKILVPVDFSSYSAEAVAYAAELARRYDAPMTLVHVYQAIAYTMPEGFMPYSPEYLANMLTEFRRRLAQAQTDAEAAGAQRVETRLLQGDICSEIVKLAAEEQHDLIVMGTHGRTGPAHLLLGSVAEKVVRRAPCPVLTVRRTTPSTPA